MAELGPCSVGLKLQSRVSADDQYFVARQGGQPTLQLDQLRVGQYVGCVYDAMWWVGVVEEKSEEHDVQILFMHPSGPAVSFKWPAREDRCWVYGHICMINRIEADLMDVLVDQWPDFNVLFTRPKRQQKSGIYEIISVFTKDETTFRNMLIGTDVLDWKQFFRLSTDVRHEEMLKAVAVMRGVPMSKMYVCHVLKLQDPSNLTMERLPLQVSSLNESHVALVNSSWKFGMSEFSEAFIRNMIMNFPSCCMLDSEGQPVSWMLTYSCCAIGMLYTLPEHRRKGYAKALVTILAKKLHSEGCPVYCLIEEENQLSYRLFTSLGFTEDPSFRITGFKFNQVC